MLTTAEIIQQERTRIARRQPSSEELRQIPLERPARLVGRLSDPKQIQESLESMAELADLVGLARQDGLHTELSDEEVARRISAIQKEDPEALRYWVDGQVVTDLRDLGISGRLGPEKRAALAELMADLSRGEAPDVTGTIYLSSEGLSRLTRDQDEIIGPQLLKLMKLANCRLRTPFATYNPRIESDWRDLKEKFEDAAKESRHLQREHFGPKIRGKAAKGEHVGNQVPPGFIIDIKGYKTNGSFIFGKWLPYEPHIPIVIKALQEYIRCGGSKYRAAQALRGTYFPLFPEELKYMRSRSALRNALKTEAGFIISAEIVEGLALNVALIGIWKWTDILIINNHPAIVDEELFREAYALATSRGGKAKGRAAYFEPLDLDGLLWCHNHTPGRRVSGHPSERKWVCDRDYHNGQGPVCLDIRQEIISEPVIREILKCLDLGERTQAVLGAVQGQVEVADDELARRKREEIYLVRRQANLENYLGDSDPEIEQSYRRQVKQVKAQLMALRQKPLPPPITPVDFNRVRNFLSNLDQGWQKLSPRLRNRLLKLIIDRVEITHDRKQIQALVFWKSGFIQKILIERPLGSSARERWWSSEHDRMLQELWPTATKAELLAAFPGRDWRAILSRANTLHLKRQVRHYPTHWKPWTEEDDALLIELYVKIPTAEVATRLGRSLQAVTTRASQLKIAKPLEILYPAPSPVWEVYNYYGLERLSPSPQPTLVA